MIKWTETILIFLRGFLMGLADTIPGVSGGTIAFITGIYNRLVSSIAEIPTILRAITKKDWKKIRSVDFALFIPLGLGIALAIVLFSKLMSYLLENQTAITHSFFFGLILASSLFIFRKIEHFSPTIFLTGFVGFLFSFLLIGFGVTDALGHSLPVLFFSGAIAISAMILPGISGAFILLLIGQYEFLINALHSFDVISVSVTVAGAVIGLLSFSRLLKHLMQRFPSGMLSFLAGLMLGSLRLTVERTASSFSTYPPVIISCIVGFFVVFLLELVFVTYIKG